MKAPKASKKSARRTRMYSTSEGRANFAEALEAAQSDGAIIGFERYGRPVAALAPIEAVMLLAGVKRGVDARTRAAILQAAQDFVRSMPEPNGEAVEAAPKAPPKKAPAKKKRKAARAS
jgi:antitoxin (DNA-binding transcriptional repressor) of toxin-antitoxin stability system